jgi:hypothetical protein
MPHRRRFVAMFASLACLTVLSLLTLVQAQPDPPLPLPLNDSAASLHSRATVELLLNTSFETDSDGDGDKIPDGWTGKNTSVSKADKQKCNKNGKVFAYSGICAFIFKGNPGGEKSKLKATLTNLTSIADGSTLRLSAHLDPRSGVPDSKVASVKLKLTNGTKLKLELRLPNGAITPGYTQLIDSQAVTIPTGVVINKAKLDLRYGETSGKFLVDDVSLAVITTDPPTTTPLPTSTARATNTPTSLPPAQLFASDGAANDEFGASVSLSGDGNLALIGAPWTDIGTKIDVGVAQIFVRTGTTWAKWQPLTAPSGATDDRFASSVSLSADGSTALVGAYSDVVGTNPLQGSAYVFVRLGGQWIPQQQLITSDGNVGDQFGRSVSLSADGNTALVAAVSDAVGANNDQGSAYIFIRTGTTWTQQQKLVASDGAAFDYFGRSVSLSADGSTALVGAASNDVGANSGQGSAYVFVRTGTTWTQQQLIASDGAAGDDFGHSVSLSADGNTALVGARLDNVITNTNQGSAYVFVRTGTTWTQQQQLIASDGVENDFFGTSVSLSANGSIALVGASWDDVGANDNQGSVYVFTRTGSLWTQQQKLVASDGVAGDTFGNSVSLSADGSTALVGVAYDDVGANEDQGSAWVFDLSQ